MLEQIHDIYKRSIFLLYDDQAVLTGKTLMIFADMFATDDFDIDCFNGNIVS